MLWGYFFFSGYSISGLVLLLPITSRLFCIPIIPLKRDCAKKSFSFRSIPILYSNNCLPIRNIFALYKRFFSMIQNISKNPIFLFLLRLHKTIPSPVYNEYLSENISRLFARDTTQLSSLYQSTQLFDLEGIEAALPHFHSPVPGGLISDDFHPERQHYGVDIVAPKGTMVHSVAQGRVVFSSWTEQEGYVVMIQHANNLISFYKHNEKLLKAKGDNVYASEPIAVIGNTGELSTGPHLHFELWYTGIPLDCKNFITFD